MDDVEEETEATSDDFFNKRILTICYVLQAEGRMVASGSFKGGERKILEDFTQFIQEQDPDVITGYNIEGYDLRVVEKRANELRVPLSWGRDGSLLEGRRDQKYNKPIWNVTGRMIMDTWWAVKMDLRPKQETLNAVSKLLLGEETKLDVDPRHMDEEWAKDEGKVLHYCKRDAELALRILNKLERVRKVMDLATVSKLPLDDVLKGRSSLLIDSILIREADRSAGGRADDRQLRTTRRPSRAATCTRSSRACTTGSACWTSSRCTPRSSSPRTSASPRSARQGTIVSPDRRPLPGQGAARGPAPQHPGPT